MSNVIVRDYIIPANDFTVAGEASSSVRKIMTQLGVNPTAVKRTSIAMYEAEINAVIHGHGGKAHVEIDENKIFIKISDQGPGIADLDLAMQEGYSTASDSIREMGFGAGMGLPNIKKHSDVLQIDTELNKGTIINITVFFKGSSEGKS